MSDHLKKEIGDLKRDLAELQKLWSKLSPDCICFPENEQPSFDWPLEGDIAFSVKCPVHGDRFKWPVFFVYVSKWSRQRADNLRQRRSHQYKKAWETTFPPHLWPAEEEVIAETRFLRLKDGTRIRVSEIVRKP
jgi:hypothetical protein